MAERQTLCLDAATRAATQGGMMGEEMKWASYTCVRCGKNYFVNDGTWRLCASDFCHSCLAHLNKQYAAIPDPEPLH